ncbi:MAG: nicotinate-nucleotide--dimethylbenzimidazole phosphoribosyltransferase [Gammaproteobacteria bacterium]|nr:nicotinate-nucleotide--dimethylbenzimidazole phosphoribosyltransferase [Gammaproteobacteria bacterium]MDH5802187.1 nicotinate-nucleotide--dimethylbenzimidazole phosphoribosyltransferase [Gammaproteobacteria bacterium]
MTADWLNVPCASVNTEMQNLARDRQGRLTKPPGALGRLETVAIQLAGLQGRELPQIDTVHITVFAGDHGVAAQGVSAFPQAVTAEMVRNFARGGAAINVLAKSIGASLQVINLGTAVDPGDLPLVQQARLGPGTQDFTQEAAMSEQQLFAALNTGRQAAEKAALEKTHLFIGGEMGIGNTTAAAAVACALLNQDAAELAGPGTGLDDSGVQHKIKVINQALQLHQSALNDPLQVLRCLGGFEIAAMTGAFISCAHTGTPVLVDGFISSVAALLAQAICPGASQWFLYAHRSAEPGHRHIVEALDAKPLLDMGMRLGEGSGAATAVPLLRLACALHANMATFAEAGVSEKEN